MRRFSVLLTAIVTVCLASPAFAQTTADKSFGVTAGFGLGYGTVPDGTSRKVKPTVNVGAVAVLPFNDTWAFQPELKYDRRKITIGGITTDVSYVSVPI